MSFSTQPKAPPASNLKVAVSQPNMSQALREKAMAAFMTPTTQEQATAVKNPNNISPEEMSAVVPKSNEIKQVQESSTQNLTSEAPAQVSPEATKETESQDKPSDPLSSQYALLAKKEKALRAQIQAHKAREEELKKREAAISSKDSEYTQNFISREKLKSNPLEVLSELGVSYDDITAAVLNSPNQVPHEVSNEIKALREELKSLRSEQENSKKSFEEQQKQAYQQAVNQLKRDATALVESDPATYEAIKSTNSVSDVVELIEETFKRDGYVMTVEEAAKEVEEYLIEEAARLSKLSKIQKMFQPKVDQPKAQASEKQVSESKPSQTQQQMKTLTNAVNASRPLTARERAIAAYEGKLNK